MTYLGWTLIGFGLLILSVIAACLIGRMIATPDEYDDPTFFD